MRITLCTTQDGWQLSFLFHNPFSGILLHSCLPLRPIQNRNHRLQAPFNSIITKERQTFKKGKNPALQKFSCHSAQNSKIKFYTQKSAKIGFSESFCRSSPNFATDLLQTCYKRLERGPPTRFIINLQK